MKEIEKIPDYQEIVLDLILTQFKDSTKLQGLIQGKSDQINSLEQAFFNIRDYFYLDTATGDTLDVIGKIWDVDRQGFSDEVYREAIQFKISLKISGTLPEIITILKTFYNPTYIEFYPAYPAKFLLITDAEIDMDKLNKILPAGVGAVIKNKDDVTVPVFGFHSDTTDSIFAITYNLDLLGYNE